MAKNDSKSEVNNEVSSHEEDFIEQGILAFKNGDLEIAVELLGKGLQEL